MAPWMAAMRATPMHVALLRLPLRDELEGGRLHADDAAGARHAVRLGLGRHVDHVRLALGVEMRQRRTGRGGGVGSHGGATFSNMAVS